LLAAASKTTDQLSYFGMIYQAMRDSIRKGMCV